MFDVLSKVTGGSDEEGETETDVVGAQSGDNDASDDASAETATVPEDLSPADFRERAETLAGRSDVPELDFSEEALPDLDTIATGNHPVDDRITYGSYLGETLVREYDGEWVRDDGWGVNVDLGDDETIVAVFDAATMALERGPVFEQVAEQLHNQGDPYAESASADVVEPSTDNASEGDTGESAASITTDRDDADHGRSDIGRPENEDGEAELEEKRDDGGESEVVGGESEDAADGVEVDTDEDGTNDVDDSDEDDSDEDASDDDKSVIDTRTSDLGIGRYGTTESDVERSLQDSDGSDGESDVAEDSEDADSESGPDGVSETDDERENEGDSDADGPASIPSRSTYEAAAIEFCNAWSDQEFDYMPESLARLDSFLDGQWEGRFRPGSLDDSPTDPEVGSGPLVQVGAYVGEVLIRHYDGDWVPDEDGEAAVAVAGRQGRREVFSVFNVTRTSLTDQAQVAYQVDALANRLGIDEMASGAAESGFALGEDGPGTDASSADVITTILDRAAEFVDEWEGYDLNYRPASLVRLDNLTKAELDARAFQNASLGDHTDGDALRLTDRATGASAYFAAVLVRHLDAQWEIDETVALSVEGVAGETRVVPFEVGVQCLRQEAKFMTHYDRVHDAVDDDPHTPI